MDALFLPQGTAFMWYKDMSADKTTLHIKFKKTEKNSLIKFKMAKCFRKQMVCLTLFQYDLIYIY